MVNLSSHSTEVFYPP
uniref:Uncharacterized protein n=1 Tax=Rhizophora mucronata TaxID=61149 RepID=A0A2P2LQW0_RHIMU